MSEEENETVEFNKDEIESTINLSMKEGDTIIVTLPDLTHLPNERFTTYGAAVRKQMTIALESKGVKVMVIPFGMKVELLRKTTEIEIDAKIQKIEDN